MFFAIFADFFIEGATRKETNMETYDKEKFVNSMNNIRTIMVGRLANKIKAAEGNKEEEITINVHDAHWILTALIHHFDAEKGDEEENK